MVRSELIAAISEKNPHLAQTDVELSVKAILDEMAQHLSRGGRIEFRGFGSFSVTVRLPRMGLNPKTGVKVSVPEKRVTHFKASKELRSRVDSISPAKLVSSDAMISICLNAQAD